MYALYKREHRCGSRTAPEVSHNEKSDFRGWDNTASRITAIRGHLSLWLLRGVPDALSLRLCARAFRPHVSALCLIPLSRRLICVRNNLTPVPEPALVATSPLAISTATRLIVMTIAIRTTLVLERQSPARRAGIPDIANYHSRSDWLRIINNVAHHIVSHSRSHSRATQRYKSKMFPFCSLPLLSSFRGTVYIGDRCERARDSEQVDYPVMPGD